MPSGADLSTILNRILDAAADNLRIAKILIQMGLDPDNITYDALFNRLLEIVLANITLANLLGLIGAIFFVATLLTRRWCRCASPTCSAVHSSPPMARSPETSRRFFCLPCRCRSI